MVFQMEVTLGNAAMQTAGDIASALRKIADELANLDDGKALQPLDACSVGIRDGNGNTVGSWAVRTA